jgi:hypothetical protein
MKADAIAKKIAKIFEETNADEVSELSVGVNEAEPIAGALKQLGFDVTMEQRFADAARTKITRYVLTVHRATWSGAKADKTRTFGK